MNIDLINASLTEKVYLILEPRALLRKTANQLIAQIALKSDLFVLDGGNCFDAYGIIHGLSRYVVVDIQCYLERIHLARSFTCYQTLSLCKQYEHISCPMFVLNLSSNFYDESVCYAEREHLFESCLEYLLHLSERVPLVILERLDYVKNSMHWISRLKETAQHISCFEHIAPMQPLKLF